MKYSFYLFFKFHGLLLLDSFFHWQFSLPDFFCVFYINSLCAKYTSSDIENNIRATLCWTKIIRYFWTNKTIVPLSCWLENKLENQNCQNSILVNNTHKPNLEWFCKDVLKVCIKNTNPRLNYKERNKNSQWTPSI